MIYADTSALAKLVVAEEESQVLRSWLAEQEAGAHPLVVTNVLGVVELRRVAARVGEEAERVAAALLGRLDRLALTLTALTAAGRLRPTEVRTLDALHIASASELPDLSAVLSYDRRLLDAAAGYGLPVASPS